MKKEQYFAPEILGARSSSMLEAVRDLRERHSDATFQPLRAALLNLAHGFAVPVRAEEILEDAQCVTAA